MSDSYRVPEKGTLAKVLILSAILFAVFFFNYFNDIQRFLLSHNDWLKRLRFYADVKHQVFTLGQFPHYHPYSFKGTNVLFANAEESVLTPINLLLPFMSLYHFFIYHLTLHYLAALIGFALLRRLLGLPYFSILLMFVVFGFNGRILSNYYVGHAGFITVMWIPLLLYFYLSYLLRGERLLFHCTASALIMTLIFFEGGVHVINWLLAMFACDAILILGGSFFDWRRGVHGAFRSVARFWGLTLPLFLGLSAIKIFPCVSVWGGMQFIGGGVGYQNLIFFAQTFYQRGLGTIIPFKEFWLQEAYNYVGSVASVLAVISMAYSLCGGRDAVMRRFALISILFLIFSIGRNYLDIFGHFPLLGQERAPTRFIFVVMAIWSLLIPGAVDEIMRRLKFGAVVQEMVMCVLGLAIYGQLFSESRHWMVVREQLAPEMMLSGRYELPAAYQRIFYAGLAVTAVTIVCLLVAALWVRARSRRGCA